MPNVTPVRKGAGQLRHRLALQQDVPVVDALGGRTQTWDTYGNEWAAVDEMPLVVSETQSSVLFQVTMRYRADILEKHLAGTQLRVVTPTRTLKVLEIVNPEHRNRDLVLSCAQANR